MSVYVFVDIQRQRVGGGEGDDGSGIFLPSIPVPFCHVFILFFLDWIGLDKKHNI